MELCGGPPAKCAPFIVMGHNDTTHIALCGGRPAKCAPFIVMGHNDTKHMALCGGPPAKCAPFIVMGQYKTHGIVWGVDLQNVPHFYGPIKTSIPDGCHLRGR